MNFFVSFIDLGMPIIKNMIKQLKYFEIFIQEQCIKYYIVKFSQEISTYKSGLKNLCKQRIVIDTISLEKQYIQHSSLDSIPYLIIVRTCDNN